MTGSQSRLEGTPWELAVWSAATTVALLMLVLAPQALLGAVFFAGCLPCLLLGRPRVWRRVGPAVAAPQGEPARRRLAWRALSEFYLDTELDTDDLRRIADTLSQSNYNADELEQILYLELHPLLVWNLMGVAGEWAYFDLDWIHWQVINRRRPAVSSRRLLFGRWLVDGQWTATRQLLAAPSPTPTQSRAEDLAPLAP